MAKPWVLVYTDSVFIDSSFIDHPYKVDARECEKQELITFGDDFNYYVKLVCNQPSTSLFTGQWEYGSDSTLGYYLKTDTPVYTALDIAKLEFITTDTMRLIQQSSFAHPDIRSPYFFEKTYAH